MTAKLTKQERLDLEQEKLWKVNFCFFLNVLYELHYTKEEMVELVLKYNLLIDKAEVWDKRVKRLVVKMNIPSTPFFIGALIQEGIPREYWGLSFNMSLVDVVNVYEMSMTRYLYPNRVAMMKGDYSVSLREAEYMAEKVFRIKDGGY